MPDLHAAVRGLIGRSNTSLRARDKKPNEQRTIYGIE